jgi:hypothetical protein
MRLFPAVANRNVMLDNPMAILVPPPNLFSILKLTNPVGGILVVSSGLPVKVRPVEWGLFLPILVGPVYIGSPFS